MTRALAFLFLCMFIITPGYAHEWRISTRGYGPVRVGMSISEAERRMHTRLSAWEGHPLNPDCDYAYPAKGHEGVSFMVQGGRITHALVSSPKILTSSGFKVGDTVGMLKNRFGKNLKIEHHHYDDQSFYAFLWEPGERFGIKFETGGEVVTSISAGDRSIKLVEGCS